MVAANAWEHEPVCVAVAEVLYFVQVLKCPLCLIQSLQRGVVAPSKLDYPISGSTTSVEPRFDAHDLRWSPKCADLRVAGELYRNIVERRQNDAVVLKVAWTRWNMFTSLGETRWRWSEPKAPNCRCVNRPHHAVPLRRLHAQLE